jgi:hypothetical protein
MERKPDAMVHEPSGLLSDPYGPRGFATADPVPGIHDLPHGREPFIQTEWRIFEDRSGFKRELGGVMFRTAVPAIVLLKEENVFGTATRANDAVRPAPRNQILPAIGRIGEVNDRLLKCGRLGSHALRIAGIGYFVNYINTLISHSSEIRNNLACHAAFISISASLFVKCTITQTFPYLGRPVAGRVTLRAPIHWPILIYYQVHEASTLVEVIRLRHASRQNPA